MTREQLIEELTQLPVEERLTLLEILARSLREAAAPAVSPAALPTPLSRLVGTARGGFGSPAEADAYLESERAAWHG